MKDAERLLLARLTPAQRRQWLYLRSHRRRANLRNPTTFNEKVNWRILNDRRPLLAWTCDKLAMKQTASSSGAGVYVPRTVWHGTDITELADVDLPEHWVLKPSHRSGLVHFGRGRTDPAELRAITRQWLHDEQNRVLAEWAYSQADPRLLVEEYVGKPGWPPPDFKFFVFDGVPQVVQVDLGRFSSHTRSLFDADWRKLDVRLAHPDGGPVPRPAELEQMLDAARTLGSGFDFIRIDLYAEHGAVIFGEYTPYPGSGLDRFTPRSFDAWLGALWRLPEDVTG